MDMQLEGGDRSSNTMVYVAVGVAVVGVIAGIIGAVRGAGAARDAAAFDARLKDLERRLGEVATGSEQLTTQMNNFVRNANQTLGDFGQRIAKAERDLRALDEKLATPSSVPASARSAAGTTTTTGSGGTAAAPSGKVHEVKAGETMEKIARQLNISLADLLRLNPQVDPKRMKVGTKLNLP